MTNPSIYFLPVLLIFLLLYAAKKKVNTYTTFAQGAKSAIGLCVDLLPFLVTIFVAIQLFKLSGLTALLSTALSPVMSSIGIPPELTELMLIRPFSGSGSLAILENIYSTFGTDSYVARCASVIMGSSETIFYVATIYISKTQVKKLLYAIPVALLCNIISAIIACFACTIC